MQKSYNMLPVSNFRCLHFNVDQILKVQKQNKRTKQLETFK